MTRRTRGFTLLEVLIALLIFSLGLLGMAGLMVMSVKTNHSAYLRTQASFLATSMADRMRANSRALWTNAYDGTYSSGGADPCTGGTPCSYSQIVTRDRGIWGQQLIDSLPNASAQITCNGTAVPASAQLGNPPYNGLCSIQITWDESKLDRTDNSPTQQVFSWVFQP